MTDAEILSEYKRIEDAANRRPEGADHPAIARWVAAQSGRSLAEIRELVTANIFMDPN